MNNMSISLNVQGFDGVRSYDLQETFTELPEIKETDLISFTVICANNLGEPKVFLQDHSVNLNRHNQNGEITEYSVEYNRYLSNHFGVTSIAIAFAGSEELIRVTPVNVFATKINKEQAESILEYLSSKMEDVTNLCFSKTQVGSDSKPEAFTDTLTKIAFSRKIIETLNFNRQRFCSQPCKRSLETLKTTKYENTSYITDKDISWLFQHLDQLYPVPIDESKVTIHNRHYSIDQLQRTVKEVDTDLFENQVIYGFLIAVKMFLMAIPSFKKKYQLKTPFENFYTFDSILEKVEAPLMERRYKEARLLLQQCNELISFFKKNLPCISKGALSPVLTPQAKRYPHYEKSFRLIDSWYKLGSPAWSGSNYLFGLKSLDKLYEFFCLYKIIDSLNAIGYYLVAVETTVPERESGPKGRVVKDADEVLSNYYRFKLGKNTIELFYEPTIWSFSEFSKKGEIIDAFHSKRSYKPFFTPDFLIKLDDGGDFPSYYILDSKYSTESQTRERHLPAIIEKYYLKLKAISNSGAIDSRAVKMVYALIPKTFTSEHGYHGGAFNIYDIHASSPFFGFLKLTPEEDRPLHKLINTSFRNLDL